MGRNNIVKYIHDMEPGPVDRVLELVSLLNRDMRLSFERDGLTEARAHLLWVLQGGPVTQREIADALRVTPRNVTGLVDGLVASGHVRRQVHPADRRAYLVTLTDAGSTLLAAMVSGYAEMHDVLFGGLSERRLHDFGRTLDEVVARLRARVEEEWG